MVKNRARRNEGKKEVTEGKSSLRSSKKTTEHTDRLRGGRS